MNICLLLMKIIELKIRRSFFKASILLNPQMICKGYFLDTHKAILYQISFSILGIYQDLAVNFRIRNTGIIINSLI
ncbi:MAG: hypothetical protein A3J80_02880 [Desulfobacula sp. RIFOXYB2_FULL_45_6]|nr:MAG: hypothetical protein A3J80_02880 [Desulfobacula sp. RIFOXYB2_FULL_45_6]